MRVLRLSIALLSGLVVSGFAAPEVARISATPDWPLPMNSVVATPLIVRACVGDTVPSVVVKVTVVPFCTGVPACSSMAAEICAVPLDCTTVFVVVNVIVDWLGASSGSLSQLEMPKMVKANTAHTRRFHEAERPVMMESIGSERAV